MFLETIQWLQERLTLVYSMYFLLFHCDKNEYLENKHECKHKLKAPDDTNVAASQYFGSCNLVEMFYHLPL